MIKKHWPVLFSLLAVLISVILMLIAINSTDTGYAILAMVTTFMFLFPLSSALVGGWYGWKMSSPRKWILPSIVYAGTIVYLFMWNVLTQSDLLEIDSYMLIGIPSCLACLIAEIILSIIVKIRNKKFQ